MDETFTDDDVTATVRRAEEAADALVRGDMETYLRLAHHVPGYTLMDPFGGPAKRYDDYAERQASLRQSGGYFRGGEARLENVETHAWGDTLVLVAIERQHGEVGDLPDQDLFLRVTQVYRRDGADWQLVHRHADPLVRRMQMDELAELMHG
jgi:ketosteroid isomerase-like protein